MKKIVVISGGSDGLGRVIAQRLSAKHKVIILAPNEDKLKKVTRELGCDYTVCDVSNCQSVEFVVARILTKYERVDCLINNAAIWIEGELDTNKPERIKRTLEVNTLGAIFLTRAVVPQFKKQRQGLIINVISHLGLIGKEKRSVYVASKWAITGFTKSLKVELAPYGIGVTGIYPTKMDTNLFAKTGIKKDMSDALDPDEVAKTIEFILSFKPTTLFTEIGMRHLKYLG